MNKIVLEYKLLDDFETYTVGKIPENKIITKDFLNVQKVQNNPRIEFKDSNGLVTRFSLIEMKSDHIASGEVSGIPIGVRIAPLKNDKSKVSLYIKKVQLEKE